MGIVALRHEITQQLKSYFGKRIQADERLLQVLEYSAYCRDGWMDDADIFSVARRHLPSLNDLFVRAGVSQKTMADAAEYMFKIASIEEREPSAIDLWPTLFFAFPDGSTTFKSIRRQARLTTLDLIIGELQADLDSLEYDEIGSELTSSILEAVKLDSHHWNEENWQYIKNLAERIRFLEHIDQSLGDQQFVLYWDGSQYRIRPFGTTGIYQFSQKPLKDKSLWIARGDVIQPIQRFRDEAFEELEYLINQNSAEKEFQLYFERNPEFLLALGGGQYVNLHPQVIIHEDTSGHLIPDFLLEKVNDHLCDICDLKLATQAIKRYKRHRPGFRAAIHEAIAQLDFYRNWFEDKQHRDEFYKKTGLKAYRPRVVLIVGRKLDYYTDIERIQRESLLPNHVEIVTYDDVLERARAYRRLLES